MGNNTVLENDCSNNDKYGIYLSSSNHTFILDNNCSNIKNLQNNDGEGIYLDSSKNNTVLGNDCSNNDKYGISLKSSNNTLISENNCSNNGDTGIYLDSSSNNTMWKNIVAENSQYQAYCSDADENNWDNGIIGNYWDDYTERHPDATNNSVVWDIPYKINGTINTYDEYPMCKKTIEDTVAPQWDPMPEDQDLELGEPLNYDLNATDFQPVLYDVNGTDFTIDSSGLLTNDTLLAVGNYVLVLNASDGTNDNITEISILVENTQAPQWDPMPEDQDLELGEPLNYDLNATDFQPVLYDVNGSDFTIDSSGLLTNDTLLAVGNYVLVLNASDGISHNITTITITVLENADPFWEEPLTNQIVYVGQSFRYDVNASDNLAIDQYWINLEDTFHIDNEGVITNITALPKWMVYTLVIHVNDTSGNEISASIDISVQEDGENPIFDPIPEDQTIMFGEPFRYDVNATDNVGIDQYWVNLNEFQINEDGVITNATVLQVKTYGLMISVNDTNGRTQSIWIEITVKAREGGPAEISGYDCLFIMGFALLAVVVLMRKSFRRRRFQN
ncbi:MAG: NosD domain-containing protein [Promethearchaeia archaeon]